MQDIFTKIYLQSINNQYEPPYTEQQMRENGYSQDIILKLKRDPIHGWRMKTGIEVIHRQPTKTQLQRIWKNWQLMNPQQKRISDQKCKQVFGVTNQFLYNYLIPQYKTNRPNKTDVKYPVMESKKYKNIPNILEEDRDLLTLNPAVIANIHDNLVYHSSPFKLSKLKGEATSDWSKQKGNVFVTPFKGIASCFIINRHQILNRFEKLLGKRITNCNFNYDVWNFPNDQLLDIIDTVNVTIQRSGIQTNKTISGIATGYLYTIDFNKYKDRCHMFNKQINSDVQFVIQGDVDYQKVQKITVNWTCNIKN